MWAQMSRENPIHAGFTSPLFLSFLAIFMNYELEIVMKASRFFLHDLSYVKRTTFLTEGIHVLLRKTEYEK